MNPRQTAQDQDMKRWLRPIESVIDGADSGVYTLPEELVSQIAELRAVQEAIAQVQVPPDSPGAAAVLADEVGVGEIPPDLGERLLDAEHRFEAARAQLHVLRLAERRIASELSDMFEDDSVVIVVEHLRPALESLLATAGKLAPKLRGAFDASSLIALNDEAALKAWTQLGGLAARYATIRDAYRELLRGQFDFNSPESAGLIAYRNYYELARHQGRVVVPSEPAAFMAWLAVGAGGVVPEAWLPLPSEIEDVIREARERVGQEQTDASARIRSQWAAAGRREMREREERERGAEPFAGLNPVQ